jgi:hypothetical protein
MNIDAMPATYAEAEQFFDGYEATHVAPSSEGQQLMDATVQVFQGRLPRLCARSPGRSSAQCSTTAVLSQRSASLAPPALPSRPQRRACDSQRHPPPSAAGTKPHFTPGKAGSSLYPGGYSLGQIGPINVPPSPARTGNELS